MANQIVKLKDGDNYLFPVPSGLGVNPSDILFNISKNNDNTSGSFSTYTATKDCFAVIVYADVNAFTPYQLRINGTMMYDYGYSSASSTRPNDFYLSLPLKKGDKFEFRCRRYAVRIYGYNYN